MGTVRALQSFEGSRVDRYQQAKEGYQPFGNTISARRKNMDFTIAHNSEHSLYFGKLRMIRNMAYERVHGMMSRDQKISMGEAMHL